MRPQIKRAAVRAGALGALGLFGAGAATVFAGCALENEPLHWAGAGFVVSGLVLWGLLAWVDERSLYTEEEVARMERTFVSFTCEMCQAAPGSGPDEALGRLLRDRLAPSVSALSGPHCYENGCWTSGRFRGQRFGFVLQSFADSTWLIQVTESDQGKAFRLLLDAVQKQEASIRRVRWHGRLGDYPGGEGHETP